MSGSVYLVNYLVCNHPDLLEQRAVDSPFLMEPLTFHLPRLMMSTLTHDLARGYTGPVWEKLPVRGKSLYSFKLLFHTVSCQKLVTFFRLIVFQHTKSQLRRQKNNLENVTNIWKHIVRFQK